MSTTTETTRTADIGALDPKFAQMGRATIQHAWAIPELTDREKVFLTVVADVCQPSLGLPLELHVRGAAQRGVSTSDLRELLRFISYDAGYHAALGALDRLAEIEEVSSLAAELLDDSLVKIGPGAAPSPLPEPVRAQLNEMDPHFTEYFDLQARMRSGYEPGTLSVRERAFTTMSVDVHYQTLGDTFQIHVNRALRGGATPNDVRAVLRFLAQFGATKAWNAWRALNEFLVE